MRPEWNELLLPWVPSACLLLFLFLVAIFIGCEELVQGLQEDWQWQESWSGQPSPAFKRCAACTFCDCCVTTSRSSFMSAYPAAFNMIQCFEESPAAFIPRSVCTMISVSSACQWQRSTVDHTYNASLHSFLSQATKWMSEATAIALIFSLNSSRSFTCHFGDCWWCTAVNAEVRSIHCPAPGLPAQGALRQHRLTLQLADSLLG